jgi:hypothetical protein
MCFTHVSHMFTMLSVVIYRDCHRFMNPHRLRQRVDMDTGVGWQIATSEKPMPMAWVCQVVTL